MKSLKYLSLIILTLIMSTKVAGSEESSAPQYASLPPQSAQINSVPSRSDNASGTNISLDLRDIEIIDALKFLAAKAAMNIIPTKKVSGRITLMVENTRASDVFDIILRSNALAYDKKGRYLQCDD